MSIALTYIEVSPNGAPMAPGTLIYPLSEFNGKIKVFCHAAQGLACEGAWLTCRWVAVGGC